MFDVDKLYVAMKEILRGKDGRLQFAKYLTEENSTLQERKLAYLSRTDEGKKIKSDSRIEIKKISEDIELAKKAQAISDDSQSVVKEGDKKFTIKEKGNPEIIETEDITSYEGTKGAAQYDSKNNQIKVNRTFLKQKFAEKAWTKPRELMEVVNGENIKSSVNALPEDQFKTYEEWEQFVINHEYQHSLYSREDFNRDFPNKKKGDYEEYINRRALLQVTDIDSLNEKKDALYTKRDEAILKLMTDEEFSKIPIEEQNTVAARNNRLIDITLGVMRNPSTAEAIFTPGGYDYLKDTVHKDITEAMAQGVGKVRKATNMFDADDVDLMTYQNIAGRDLKGIAASHNKFRALIEHSNLKMVNPFLFNGKQLSDLSGKSSKGLDTSGGKISRNVSEILAASVDNGKDPLLADINYSQHTAEIIFMMLSSGVPSKTVFAFINQKPVRDAMQMVFLGDANNLEDALKTIFKKVNSGNPYSSSKVKPVNFDEKDLIDDINSESLVHTRNVVGSLLKYIEYSKDFSKIIRASKADTNGIGKFVEEGVTLLKAMKDAMAAEAKSDGEGGMTGNIIGIEEFLSGIKDKELGEGSTNPNKMTQAFTKYGVELPMEEVFEKMYPYSKSLFKSVKAKIGEIAKFPLSAEENRDINDHLIQFLTSDYQFYSVGDRKEFVRKVVANFDKLKAGNPKLFAENAMLRTIGTPFDKTLGMKILKFDNSITLSQEQVQDIYEGFAELYKPADDSYVDYDSKQGVSEEVSSSNKDVVLLNENYPYTKLTAVENRDTNYIFTENAEAYTYSQGLVSDLMGDIFPYYPNPPKINVTASNNQAGIRTDSKGVVNKNAYGIIVKKYQQDKNGYFVKQDGGFKDNDADFELFTSLNKHVFERLKESSGKIVVPKQFALGKAALPLRFVEWLKQELESELGVASNILENNTYGYSGYGLQVTGVGEIVGSVNKKSTEAQLFDLAKDIIRYSYIMTGHKYAPSSVKTVIPHDIYLQIGAEYGVSITDKMNDIMKMKEDKALEDRFIDQYIRNNHTNTKIVEKIPEDEDGFYKNNGITANADGMVFNGLKTPEGFPTVYVEGVKDPVLTYISMPVKIAKGDKTVQEIRLFKFDNRSVKPMAMFTRIGTLGSGGQVYEYGLNIGYSNNESIIESNNISSGETEAEKNVDDCNVTRKI